MKKTHSTISILLTLCGLLLAPAAVAQATRTWVSGVGDDANPCSRTAPCKTFAGAISKTADGGIINALDPGGFGAVTIAKSITIDGAGTQAGILASFANGVNVNGAGITVTLRNLSIEGAGTGLTGVNYVQGAFLSIENCKIFGFRQGQASGVRMATAGHLTIKDSYIADTNVGVHLETPSGQMVSTLDNVRIENTGTYGILAANTAVINLMVRRSMINNNGNHGIYGAGPSVDITVVDSSVSFNQGVALFAAYPGTTIRISGDTLVNNGNRMNIVGGAAIASDGTSRASGASTSAPNASFANQ
jgi:hypothetical protein